MERWRASASQNPWPVQRTSGEHDLGEYRESWGKESLGEMVRPCQDRRISAAGGPGTIPPGVDHCRGFRQIPYSSTETAAQRTDSGRVAGNSLKASAQVQVSSQAAQTLAGRQPSSSCPSRQHMVYP